MGYTTIISYAIMKTFIQTLLQNKKAWPRSAGWPG